MGSYVIGIDVGGTKIAAGLVDLTARRLIDRRSLPTPRAEGGRVILDAAVTLAAGIRDDARRAGREAVGIGVSVCELVDLSGAVRSGSAVDWVGLPAQERFAELAPAVIEADVRAHALAEATWGAGRGHASLAFISVGTGISSCMVLDGRPYAGARGNALVLSTQASGVPCPRCSNTHWPALEEVASGPALAARFGAASGIFVERAEDVLSAALHGDERARDVVVSGATALGARLGWLVDVLDPEVVIVGGGLGSVDGLYWETLVAATRAHVWADASRGLPIRHAALGPDAALFGAALTIIQRLDPTLVQEATHD